MPIATAPARRRTRQLDSLAGLTAVDAISRVRGLELRPAVEPCEGSPGDHGLVLAQDPAPGSQVGRGQLVLLLVGDCTVLAEPRRLEPALAEPPAESGLAAPPPANPAPPARPQPPAEPVAPRRARALATEPPGLRAEPGPLPLFEPEPVAPPVPGSPPPPAREVEVDPVRPPGGPPASSEPCRPRAARRERTRGNRSRHRRLLVLTAASVATGVATLSLGAGASRLTDPAAPRTERSAARPGAGERHRHARRGPGAVRSGQRATVRPTSSGRAASAIAQAVAAPARSGETPRPRRVATSPGRPVPEARPAQPDPASPIGPVPGPPPSQTGGTP